MTPDQTTDSSSRRRNRRRSAARSARARLARELGTAPSERGTAALPDLLSSLPGPAADDLLAGIVIDQPEIVDPFEPLFAADRQLPAFAHASEAEMARILDYYRIRWEYEPHTFPILWNLDGTVVESFSPDFWLPDLDLYLEMTTLRQKLVRKKNRKLRRVRELYPELRVKLYYARDFRALMLKFGRLALADELTGSSGQVVPDRSADDPEGPEGIGEVEA